MIVCATIVKNGKVLLVKHSSNQKPDYGYWLLPAGRVEKGENLEEALKREMMKELSISIEKVRKLIDHIDPYTGDKITNFLCTPLTSKVEISAELEEVKWFNLKEVKKLRKIHPSLKQFLLTYLKF